jgi:DNA-binding IclR family transcriptional regulator
MSEGILKILRRRPLSLTDLSEGMGIPEKELEEYINPLVREGKILPRSFRDSIYYEIPKEP